MLSRVFDELAVMRCGGRDVLCRGPRVGMPHQLSERDDVGPVLGVQGREAVPERVGRARCDPSPDAGAFKPAAEDVRRIGRAAVIEKQEL